MIQAIRNRMNQKGFTLVELMVVIAILGVLAAIAIPKFSESTDAANTAKIQADLRTIESAIMTATAASEPTITMEVINTKYLASEVTPPTGKCFMETSADSVAVPTGGYAIETISGAQRAVLGTGNTLDKFKKGTTTTP